MEARLPLSRRKKFFFTCVMVFLAFCVVELGMRVFYAVTVGPSVFWFGFSAPDYRPPPRDPYAKTSHPEPSGYVGGYLKYAPHDVRYDHDPDTGEGFEVTINTHGFRGREYETAKPPNIIRVVTLGASSTFGYTDRDDETYPHYLEGLLNERSPDERKFEVINLGIPHERSDQMVALFLAEAVPLQPDVVTFYEGVNDSKYGTATPTTVAAGTDQSGINVQGSPDVRSRLQRVSLVRGAYRAVRDRLIVVSFLDSVVIPLRPRRFSPEEIRRHMAGKTEAFLANLARIAEECQKRGIVFIVATQQAKSMAIERSAIKGVTYADEVRDVEERLAHLGHVSGDEMYFLTHSRLMNAMRSWASARGLPLVDVIRALDGERDVLVSWVHLSPKGNQMIAKAFAEEILKQPLIATK
jgi:lysophospholipase L1-like esterase